MDESKTVTAGSQPSSESRKRADFEKLSDRHMDRLWKRMAGLYGNRWTASFGVADKNHAWLSVLQGLTVHQVADGISRTAKAFPSWPPTAGEFRALCRTEAAPEHKALPKPQPYTRGGRDAVTLAGELANKLLADHGNDDIAAARAAIADQRTPEANALRADLARFERARQASAWRRA